MDKIEKVNLKKDDTGIDCPYYKSICNLPSKCGVAANFPCLTCKQDECPVTEGLVQIESIEEAYDLGYSEGLDMGYCDGYEDGIRHIPPTVADDDLESLYEDCSEGDEDDYCPDFYADGSYLHKVENAKQLLHKIRIKMTALSQGEDIDIRAMSLDMITVITLLSQIQEQYVIDEMYKYLGYCD